MKINSLEVRVIREFLREIDAGAIHDEGYYSDIPVKERDYTSVGFFTYFENVDKLYLPQFKTRYVGGSVHANLNDSILTGYLMYVEESYLVTIEGYTYGDDLWPQEIHSLEVYH